jgi:hypothetical protein
MSGVSAVLKRARVLADMASIACLAMAGLALLSGCSVQPWVKPYERERLADPIMSASRGTLAEKSREHARDVREGARGATGVQGGGCGCN